MRKRHHRRPSVLNTLQARRNPAAIENEMTDIERMSVEDSLQILYPTVPSRIPNASHAGNPSFTSHTSQSANNGTSSGFPTHTSSYLIAKPPPDSVSAPAIEGCITPHHDTLTPAFGRHRRHDSGFAPAVIRSAPAPVSETTTPSDLAQTFISSYQIRSAQIRPEVLELMANNNSAFQQEHSHMTAARAAENLLIDASMRSVVESSFAAIEPYAAELNHTLARTDLRIGCTPPSLVTERTGARTDQETSYYRARISSKSFSIVIRGDSTTVNFYMLPVSVVMALSKSEDQFEPLMSFTATAHGAILDWQVEGKPLTSERQERYCLLLFNHLLEQTREHLVQQSAGLRRA
jgi:hypothetical protein